MGRMRMCGGVVGLSLLALGALGCGLLGKKEKTEEEAAPARTTAPEKTSSVASTSEATGERPSQAKTLLPGRSAIPTVDEWAKVREVTVKGSSALGCETKMVREWLRISCHGKNDTGGTPTTLSITKGAGRDSFTYAAAGITSLVMAFVEGTDLEASFSWTDKSHKLVARWPKGAPKPIIVGVFEGAKSPLDAKQCMECMDERDEMTAQSKGLPCCANQPCKRKSDCEKGRACCAGMMGAFCQAYCDMGNSTPVCTSDADCPDFYGHKLVCRQHGFAKDIKNCQSP